MHALYTIKLHFDVATCACFIADCSNYNKFHPILICVSSDICFAVHVPFLICFLHIICILDPQPLSISHYINLSLLFAIHFFFFHPSMAITRDTFPIFAVICVNTFPW
eukprot:717753_1